TGVCSCFCRNLSGLSCFSFIICDLCFLLTYFHTPWRRFRCRYNHSERKNQTKFFAEPPPHWLTTISHRLNPLLHPLLQTNHPLLFVFYLPLSTESLLLHL